MTISQKALIQKIIELKGNLSAVARSFEISRSKIYERIENDKSGRLKKAVQEARDMSLDVAESMLQERMKESDTLLIFYLKTQGKRRGYVERQERTGADGEPTKIVIEYADNHPNPS